MDLVSSDGEVGAQAGGCDRLLSGAGAGREGRGDVHGLALSGSGGVEVFPDAVGVDEPGGHARGGGDRGGGDDCADYNGLEPDDPVTLYCTADLMRATDWRGEVDESDRLVLESVFNGPGQRLAPITRSPLAWLAT